jgi:hypothetical protein
LNYPAAGNAGASFNLSLGLIFVTATAAIVLGEVVKKFIRI